MAIDGASQPRFTLYSRRWCHLCDDMLSGLHTMQATERFDIEVVDVDSEPALEAVYGELVPVLMHGENRLCHYHLDTVAVTEYLRKIR